MARFLAAILILAALACSRPSQSDVLDEMLPGVALHKLPAQVGRPVEVEFKSHLPVARVDVEATMTHPGMTPVMLTLSSSDERIWRGSFQPTMAGDWVLIFRGHLKDGRKFTYEARLPGVVP